MPLPTNQPHYQDCPRKHQPTTTWTTSKSVPVSGYDRQIYLETITCGLCGFSYEALFPNDGDRDFK
jgi:hypothetical protein